MTVQHLWDSEKKKFSSCRFVTFCAHFTILKNVHDIVYISFLTCFLQHLLTLNKIPIIMYMYILNKTFCVYCDLMCPAFQSLLNKKYHFFGIHFKNQIIPSFCKANVNM